MQKAQINNSFPLNAWYVMAWDVEIKPALFARKIANKPLVAYRKANNEVVVLDDACWHRLVPLSKGHLKNDEVVCAYHGLVYNADGRCTHMPSQETINPSACVKSYPVVEKHRFVWVWMGDPAKANPDLVPDMHWNKAPNWAGDGKVIRVKCNYKLVVDNLMDLTHETFVHAGTIGDIHVAESPFETTYNENTVTVTRWMLDIVPPSFWQTQLSKKTDYDGKVDRWQIITFQPPCTVNIDVGVAPTGTGAPEGNRNEGVNGFVLNTITPETEDTCHYFWAFARNYALDDQSVTIDTREGVSAIFRQDEEVLEAQQLAITENPDKVFYNLHIDSGAMWSRKLTDKMIEKENSIK